jgi:hypothetical protein
VGIALISAKPQYVGMEILKKIEDRVRLRNYSAGPINTLKHAKRKEHRKTLKNRSQNKCGMRISECGIFREQGTGNIWKQLETCILRLGTGGFNGLAEFACFERWR